MKFKEVFAVNYKLEKSLLQIGDSVEQYFKAYKAFLQDDVRKT